MTQEPVSADPAPSASPAELQQQVVEAIQGFTRPVTDLVGGALADQLATFVTALVRDAHARGQAAGYQRGYSDGTAASQYRISGGFIPASFPQINAAVKAAAFTDRIGRG